jgi:hypothetical protein
VNPLGALPVVLLADCCVRLFAGFLSAIGKHLRRLFTICGAAPVLVDLRGRGLTTDAVAVPSAR